MLHKCLINNPFPKRLEKELSAASPKHGIVGAIKGTHGIMIQFSCNCAFLLSTTIGGGTKGNRVKRDENDDEEETNYILI